MSMLAELRARLASLLGRPGADRDLDEELRFHVDMQARKLEASGVAPAEARRRALIALGRMAQTTEDTRDQRGIRWMEDLGRDLKHGARQLRRSPGFTLAAVVTLALGIGATTAIFSVVNGVLLRRVPFPEASRLVVAWETDRSSGTSHEPAAWPDLVDFGRRSKTITRFAGIVGGIGNLSVAGEEPVRLAALRVTHDYFPLLGIEPLVGRVFSAEDDRPGGPQVVVLGETLWRSRYGGDPAVVGRTIRINEIEYQVIGVVPADADFGLDQVHQRADYHAEYVAAGHVDLWAPLQASEEQLSRDTHPVLVVGRLASDASVAAAHDELAAIMSDLEATYPRSNQARGANVESLDQVVFGPVRPVLVLLTVAVALVLLVACVNVANLLLARGAVRTQEVAVRGALGAGAGRLGRQFLAESLLLSLFGAAAGVVLAFLALRAFGSLAPAGLPRVDAVDIDLRVLAVTLLVSLTVGLVFGLVPTVQARRVDPMAIISAEGRTGGGGLRRARFRQALVVAELALSVALVVSAGLLVRSLWTVLHVDPGFRTEGVVKAEYALPETRYPTDYSKWPRFVEIQSFNQRLLDRARALPGVTDVALSRAHPLDRGFTNSFTIVGREAEARDWPEIPVRIVTPSYFSTMGVALVRGRLLTAGDDAEAPPVALINEAAAARYFPNADPLGHEIRYWGLSRRIVGIVADERFYGLTEPAPPATYAAADQAPGRGGVLLVRGEADPRAIAGAIRTAFHDVDPEIAVYGVEPLTETVRESQAERRFAALLIGIFAVVTVLLALVGIHGVIGYATAQRSQEIGIRVALGATRGDVTGLVMRSGLRLALLGTAAGLAGAVAASGLLARFLFGVGRLDPVAFLVVPALVLLATAFATWLPARRAARAQPVDVLRVG